MKPALLYSLIFLGSAVLATLVVYGVYTVKPELFVSQTSRALPATSPSSLEDSLSARDTTRTTAEHPQDTVAVLYRQLVLLQDSLRTIKQQLKSQRTMQEVSPARSVRTDSVRQSDPKTMAAMLEAMNPEQAVKVLDHLSDEEARAVIKYINKRNVGKILGALSPTRVSRLIR